MVFKMAENKNNFKLQEIHTPSAFEGALWTLMGIKDARTILHSPPGCYINQHQNALVNDWTMELYTSNLNYSGIMQGGEDQFETALRKVAAKEPAAIFVVTSPPVEVAQDDIEGVAQKVGYKNTIVVRPPIGGTAPDGREAAFIKLLDIMDSDIPKKQRTVNIIGPAFSMFNWMADLNELKRMLRGIGISVNSVLCAGASVEEIKRAPAAELNLCIYPFDFGQETAREMEKRFAIPYMSDIIPIGFENSAQWLEKIAGFFKIDAGPFLKEAMTNAFEFIRSPMVFTVTFEMNAALSFENHNTYAVGIAEFYSKEVGVDIAMSAVSNSDAARRIEKVCDEVLLQPTIDEKREKFVATSPMAIFGNFYDKKISMDEGFKNFIFADIPSIGWLNTENCPFMGFMGAKFLVQTLVNEVYMGIFLETKGDMTGPIGVGDVPWDMDAEQALTKISAMIPHFVRAFAVKKLHQVCEETAKERGTSITVDILRQAAEQHTPSKFKAKFSEVFEDLPAPEEEGEVESPDDDMDDDFDDDEYVPIDSLTYTMPWDDDAKSTLEVVPNPIKQIAATGTEDYAKEHGYDRITAQVMADFRKEIGM